MDKNFARGGECEIFQRATLSMDIRAKRETVYKKLTDNGKILIDYGAQDLIVSNIDGVDDYEIIFLWRNK